MRIPFYDLRGVNARFEGAFLAAQSRILQSGWYLLGSETRSFESEFAAYAGVAHCVCVANGFDALRLTLEAWTSLAASPEATKSSFQRIRLWRPP